MTKCEILIVRYGLPDLEQECIDSVKALTNDVDYSITVHDNYEADEHLSKVWNDCTRVSEAEYICLLNNDTRIEENGWLKKLLEAFDKIDDLGAVGPITNRASGPQGDAKWRNKNAKRGIIEVRGPLVGFCMVFPKRLWEEIGGFDEEYAIYGEDSDFCKELQKRGYKLAIRSDVFVFHHGKSSTPIATARGKDIPALMKAAKQRYREKWVPKERKRIEAREAKIKAKKAETRNQ